MIRIDRSRIEPPHVLGRDPKSPAQRERHRAREFFHVREHAREQRRFTFKVYKHREVKTALLELFHGKCAYCESKIAGVSTGDVEHFRPKSSVVESPDHPGYWWLAMRWGNLVLSCMHCNQHRRQLNLSPEMSEEEIERAIIENDLKTTGKKSAFPTEGDTWVTDPDDDVATEEPLLIDPTVTDPEPLLDWTDRGEFCLPIAKNGSAHAQTTIAVLGLDRRWLCEQRMTVMADLIWTI